MKNGVILHLIEHGRTAMDQRHEVHGNVDEPLDEKGVQQAHAVAKKIARLPNLPDHIDASDRKRTRQTAQIISQHTGLPVRTTSALRGLNVGHWSGQNEKQVAEKLKPFFDDETKKIPGGESVEQWRGRVIQFARNRARQAKQDGASPIVVTHSNAIGAIMADAMGTEDGRKAMASPPPNGSITNVRYSGRK